jgi:hypothetical protein
MKPAGAARRVFGWRGKAGTHVHAGVIDSRRPDEKRKDRTGEGRPFPRRWSCRSSFLAEREAGVST